mgnify:CR=1 FL=1
MNKKYLITGGLGFIGKAIANNLVQQGHEVIILDNGFRHKNAKNYQKKKLKIIKADITNQSNLDKYFKNIHTVIHLAAINGTSNFYERPNLVLDVGIKGIMNVLDLCKKNKVSDFFLASSSEVYHDPPYYPADEKVPLIIPDPFNPRYTYSASKIISEILLLNTAFFNRAIIFRPHNIYGPDMGWEHVVPEFVLKMDDLISTQASQSIDFEIQGTGNETRAFVFIDDFVDGLFRVIEHGQHLNVYHIGTSNEIKLSDLAQQIASLFQAKIDIIPGDLAQGGTLRRCPDIAKLKGLGFDPQTTMEDGLKVTKKWYVENKHLKPITTA